MGLTKEQQKLVLDNHNLIYKCLNKYSLSIEEYYDVAAYALCKAALGFDPNKGYKFSTYACMAILNEFKHQFRENNIPDGYSIVSLNSFIRKEDEIEIADIVEDSTDYESLAINIAMITQNIYKLNHKEIETLNLLLDGYTQEIIAKQVGVSRQHISKMCRNIRLKLSGEKACKKHNGELWELVINKINKLTKL